MSRLNLIITLILSTAPLGAYEEDTGYWNEVYTKKEISESPTPFATYCLPKLPQSGTLLELGCGNGRDARYFAEKGHQVIACDISQTTINSQERLPNLTFLEADFTNLADQFNHTKISAIYSRFTLHSVDAEAANRTLQWAYNALSPNGILCIEVRSVKDELYGQGEPAGDDAFITSHYRRFVRMEELLNTLQKLGFNIKESVQAKGLAIYKDQDPEVIRIIAEKPVYTPSA